MNTALKVRITHIYKLSVQVAHIVKSESVKMSFFGKKPTQKEQMRETDKVIRKAQRDMTRERNDLERQEKKIQEEIKKAAKTGNKQVATILAKQLVALRKQKTKTYQVGSRMQAIGTQQKMMASNMKMAEAVGTTTKTMVNMNKLMDPQKTAQTMHQFERENAKMAMTEEMMNDALDDILNEDGDSEEEDAIVTQVIDSLIFTFHKCDNLAFPCVLICDLIFFYFSHASCFGVFSGS